jgi:hypothetical protein
MAPVALKAAALTAKGQSHPHRHHDCNNNHTIIEATRSPLAAGNPGSQIWPQRAGKRGVAEPPNLT